MAFAYSLPCPPELTEAEFRELLESNGKDPLYVRRRTGLIAFALEAELTGGELTAVQNAIDTTAWKEPRVLLRERIAEAKTAVAAVTDPTVRAAFVAVVKLLRVALQSR